MLGLCFLLVVRPKMAEFVHSAGCAVYRVCYPCHPRLKNLRITCPHKNFGNIARYISTQKAKFLIPKKEYITKIDGNTAKCCLDIG